MTSDQNIHDLLLEFQKVVSIQLCRCCNCMLFFGRPDICVCYVLDVSGSGLGSSSGSGLGSELQQRVRACSVCEQFQEVKSNI